MNDAAGVRAHAVVALSPAMRETFVGNDAAVLRSLRVTHNVDLRIDAQNKLHVVAAPDDVERCVSIIEKIAGE